MAANNSNNNNLLVAREDSATTQEADTIKKRNSGYVRHRRSSWMAKYKKEIQMVFKHPRDTAGDFVTVSCIFQVHYGVGRVRKIEQRVIYT